MFAFDDDSEFDAHMPDRLHPNRKGYELWSRCLDKGLAAIVSDRAG
jgi:lysophospholipase L1-like esterase